MFCDNNGIKEESQDKGSQIKKPKTIKPKDDPINVLKIRLAKGEITKEQYEELKSVLEK
jgi:uncharacterized membrane protein